MAHENLGSWKHPYMRSYWNTTLFIHLSIVYDCFYFPVTDLNNCDRKCALHSLTYLLLVFHSESFPTTAIK